MGLMLSSLPPSGVTPEVRGRKGVGVSSRRTLPLQRGVEVSRRAMLATTTGGRLWCSFGPLGLIAFKRYRVMDIEEIKAKVGSWPNDIKLTSDLLLYELLTQCLPGFDHERKALGPPLLDTWLHPMGACRVHHQRHEWPARTWRAEPA
jgi:hypothetical protein